MMLQGRIYKTLYLNILKSRIGEDAIFVVLGICRSENMP